MRSLRCHSSWLQKDDAHPLPLPVPHSIVNVHQSSRQEPEWILVQKSALGAAVSYRADDALHQEAVPAARSNRVWLLTRPVGFAFLSLVLMLLTWAGLAA